MTQLRELTAELLEELDLFLKQCMAMIAREKQNWKEVSLSCTVSEGESSLQVHAAQGSYVTHKLSGLQANYEEIFNHAMRQRSPELSRVILPDEPLDLSWC